MKLKDKKDGNVQILDTSLEATEGTKLVSLVDDGGTFKYCQFIGFFKKGILLLESVSPKLSIELAKAYGRVSKELKRAKSENHDLVVANTKLKKELEELRETASVAQAELKTEKTVAQTACQKLEAIKRVVVDDCSSGILSEQEQLHRDLLMEQQEQM